jgi:M-phase inducer tyrosine phosphatase
MCEPASMIADDEHLDLMEISPAPISASAELIQDSLSKPHRPRAYTSAARLFGNDLSNSPPRKNSTSQARRGALPLDWTSEARSADPVVKTLFSVVSKYRHDSDCVVVACIYPWRRG